MLPMIKLSMSESQSFDGVPVAAVSVPEEADAPDGVFADMLQTRIGERDFDTGNPLPQVGTDLPLLPLLAAEVHDPETSLPPHTLEQAAELPARPAPNPILEWAIDEKRILTALPGATVTMPTKAESTAAGPELRDPGVRPSQNLGHPTMPRGAQPDIVVTQGSLPGSALPLVTQRDGHSPVMAVAPGQSLDTGVEHLPPGLAIPERNPLVGLRRDGGPVAGRYAEGTTILQASFESGAGAPSREIELPPTRKPGDEYLSEFRPVALRQANAKTAVSADVGRQQQALRMPLVSGDPAGEQVEAVRQAVPGPSAPQAKHGAQFGTIEIEAASPAATGARFGTELTLLAPKSAASQPIELPVQDPGWDKAMSERVLLMANSRLQNAEIRLTPRDLGPLRVGVTIDDGVTSVSFHAQHAITREAIELALPRLREMLADHGLSLGQTSVGDGGVEREPDDGHNSSGANERLSDDESAPGENSGRASIAQARDGLVDTFV